MVDLFEERLRHLCEIRGLSIPKVCELAGINYKALNMQISRKSRIPLETIDDICHALDVPMSYFSKYAPTLDVTTEGDASLLANKAADLMQAAMDIARLEALRKRDQFGTEDFLNWLSSTGGRLEDCEAIIDSIDLFHPIGPEDRIPKPYRIGPQSAHSLEFNIADENQYTQHVSAYPEPFIEAIKLGHVEALHRPYMVSDVEMKGTVGGRMVIKKYRRVNAKIILPDGKVLRAVHAQIIPNTHWSNRESSRLDLIQQLPNHEDARQEG